MRVLVAGDRPSDRESARQVALGLGLECGAEDTVPLNEARGHVAAPAERGMVLVDVGANPDPALGVVNDLASVGSLVYAVGPVTDAQLLHRALNAGARGYLNRSELRDELSRAVEGLQKAGVISLKHGTTIAVIGAQAGVGVTTIATGLAFALAKETKRSVGLAELTPTVPALGLNLDLAKLHSIGDMIRMPDRLDITLIRNAAAKHADGVSVLGYPAEETRPEPLSTNAARSIRVLLRMVYDYTILDLGLGNDPGAVDLLRSADTVIVVVRPDVPNIRLARRLIRRLTNDGVPTTRQKYVVNRYNMAAALGDAKVEEGLAGPVAVWIPDDSGSVTKALNVGRPVTSVASWSRITRRLRDLANLVKTAAAR